jgi:hypothetical protein
MERQIQQIAFKRDSVAKQMKGVLDGSAKGNVALFISEGRILLGLARTLAGI